MKSPACRVSVRAWRSPDRSIISEACDSLSTYSSTAVWFARRVPHFLSRVFWWSKENVKESVWHLEKHATKSDMPFLSYHRVQATSGSLSITSWWPLSNTDTDLRQQRYLCPSDKSGRYSVVCQSADLFSPFRKTDQASLLTYLKWRDTATADVWQMFSYSTAPFEASIHSVCFTHMHYRLEGKWTSNPYSTALQHWAPKFR